MVAYFNMSPETQLFGVFFTKSLEIHHLLCQVVFGRVFVIMQIYSFPQVATEPFSVKIFKCLHFS